MTERTDVVVAVPAIASEIGEIQTVMRNDPATYWGNEDLQARYRSLLETDGSSSQQLAEATNVIPLPSVRDWAKAGNKPRDYDRYFRIVGVGNDVITRTDETDRSVLVSSFDQLPRAAQIAPLNFLSTKQYVQSEFVSWSKVERIAQRDKAAAPLVQEWGSEAPERIGKLRAVFWAIVDSVKRDADADALLRWFDQLPVSARTAVYRVLAYDRV